MPAPMRIVEDRPGHCDHIGLALRDDRIGLFGRDDQANRAPFLLASAVAGLRGVFADPRAKVCFGSVFLEGLFIHGVFPYVALLLLATGELEASTDRAATAAERARQFTTIKELLTAPELGTS